MKEEARTPREMLRDLDPTKWEDFGIVDECLWGFIGMFRNAELDNMRDDFGSSVAAMLELVVERFEAAMDRHGKAWQELAEALSKEQETGKKAKGDALSRIVEELEEKNAKLQAVMNGEAKS